LTIIPVHVIEKVSEKPNNSKRYFELLEIKNGLTIKKHLGAQDVSRKSTDKVAPFPNSPGVDCTFESEKSNKFQNVRID